MKAFSYARPTEASAVLTMLSATVRPKGGGYDLLDLAKRGVASPEALIDVRSIDMTPLVRLGDNPDLVNVLPSMTLAELAVAPVIRARCPVLSDAAAEAATPQIRNVATVAGNLLQRPRCAYFRDPFFDCLKRGGTTCPARDGVHDEMAIFGNSICCATHPSNLATALLAAAGSMVLVGNVDAAGKWTVRPVPSDTFFVAPGTDPLRETCIDPGELLAGIQIRPAPVSAYVEINQKQSFDWASVACAVVLDVEGDKIQDARVALGAVAPVPLLSKGAADALRGKPLRDEAAWDAAGIAACEGATPLRDNAHKVRQLRVVVRRAIAAAVARAK